MGKKKGHGEKMKNQTMIRVVKDKENPYVMLNKQFLQDENLSWKSKGILAYLLSLPDDWQIYETELEKHSTDGLSSLRSGLKELMKNGYVNRIQNRNGKGQFVSYEYQVHEVSTEMRKTDSGQSYNGKSHTTNNNSTNKKGTNNEVLLHNLDELNHDRYIFIYLETMKDFGYRHKRISNKNFDYIKSAINEIKEYDIDTDRWQDAVTEHFEKLPKSNDGDILAFLKAAARYFEVNIDYLTRVGD